MTCCPPPRRIRTPWCWPTGSPAGPSSPSWPGGRPSPWPSCSFSAVRGPPLTRQQGVVQLARQLALEPLVLDQGGLEPEPEPLQQCGRASVPVVDPGDDPSTSDGGEGQVDQGTDRLGRVALTSGCRREDVAHLERLVFDRAQGEEEVADQRLVIGPEDRQLEQIAILAKLGVGHL